MGIGTYPRISPAAHSSVELDTTAGCCRTDRVGTLVGSVYRIGKFLPIQEHENSDFYINFTKLFLTALIFNGSRCSHSSWHILKALLQAIL